MNWLTRIIGKGKSAASRESKGVHHGKKSNWILIGNRHSGKSTIVSAISVLAEFMDYKPRVGSYDGVTTVSYESAAGNFSVADCANVEECAKRLGEVKGLILVVSAVDGLWEPYRLLQNEMLVARHRGASEMVICLNKCDLVDDEGLLELEEFEAREMVNTGSFRGNDSPVIRCAALIGVEAPGKRRDDVGELLHVLDQLS